MGRRLAIAHSVFVQAGPHAPPAQETYSQHCQAGSLNGRPESNELVIRELYVFSNDPETKFAS